MHSDSEESRQASGTSGHRYPYAIGQPVAVLILGEIMNSEQPVSDKIETLPWPLVWLLGILLGVGGAYAFAALVWLVAGCP
jgi:hypothetical protein